MLMATYFIDRFW